MTVEFDKETSKHMGSAIASFMYDEFDLEVGELRTALMLDFFNKMIGAAAYNKGVEDAQAYLQTRLLDLEIDLHKDGQ